MSFSEIHMVMLSAEGYETTAYERLTVVEQHILTGEENLLSLVIALGIGTAQFVEVFDEKRDAVLAAGHEVIEDVSAISTVVQTAEANVKAVLTGAESYESYRVRGLMKNQHTDIWNIASNIIEADVVLRGLQLKDAENSLRHALEEYGEGKVQTREQKERCLTIVQAIIDYEQTL